MGNTYRYGGGGEGRAKPGGDFQAMRRKARAGRLHGPKPAEERGAMARGVKDAHGKGVEKRSIAQQVESRRIDEPRSYNPSAPQIPLAKGKFGFKNPLKA